MTTEKLKDLLSLNELSLTETETSQMLDIFEVMEGKEKELAKTDTTGVDIMVHVMPMTNVLREDVRSQEFKREDLLNCGPERSEDSWQVPRLVK